MGLLSRLGFKNRQEEHYQKNYEEENREKVNLGMSKGDYLTGRAKGNKREYYEEIRKRITDNDEKNIRNIAHFSNTLSDVFRKMEDEGIPLDYLVALGFAEEIDIESYNNLKVKGLSVSQLDDDLQEADETLQKQIMEYMEEIPELKRIVNLEEDSTEEEKEDAYQKAFEGIEKHSKEKEREQGGREEKEENEDVNKLRGLIDKYKIAKKKKDTKQKKRKNLEERRSIKVVGDNIEIPEIEGYNVEEVTDFSQITSLTSNRRDILVVANTIPDKLQMKFLKWIKGLETAGNRYRIVTLKGKELRHPLIEETVELTKESIDDYLEEYKDSRYTGEDVKGFKDIDQFFN